MDFSSSHKIHKQIFRNKGKSLMRNSPNLIKFLDWFNFPLDNFDCSAFYLNDAEVKFCIFFNWMHFHFYFARSVYILIDKSKILYQSIFGNVKKNKLDRKFEISNYCTCSCVINFIWNVSKRLKEQRFLHVFFVFLL